MLEAVKGMVRRQWRGSGSGTRRRPASLAGVARARLAARRHLGREGVFPARRGGRSVAGIAGAVQDLGRGYDFHALPERLALDWGEHAVAFPLGDQVRVKDIVPQFPDDGFFLLSLLDGSGQFRQHLFKSGFLFGGKQFRIRTEAEGRIGSQQGILDVLDNELHIGRQVGNEKLGPGWERQCPRCR